MMMFALLAFSMMACGEKKLTEKDLKAAEATLFNEDRSMNMENAPKVAETYCQFVKQSPDDPSAAKWLYHAMEINVMLKETDKSAELCDQMLNQYPESGWAPMSLFLMGSFVYHDQLKDTAQAHAMFKKLIEDYPDSDLVDDAKKSIQYLGMTPEEIMTLIMMSSMERRVVDDPDDAEDDVEDDVEDETEE